MRRSHRILRIKIWIVYHLPFLTAISLKEAGAGVFGLAVFRDTVDRSGEDMSAENYVDMTCSMEHEAGSGAGLINVQDSPILKATCNFLRALAEGCRLFSKI